MHKFIVSTDAAADLNVDYIKQNDVKVISMKYFLKEQGVEAETEYVFGNGEAGLTNAEFYAKLRNGGSAKTSLINAEQHKEHFMKLLEEGAGVLHVPLSSALSGTAGCAQAAADEINAELGEEKVIVVDLMGASMGQGLFVDYLVNLRNEEKTLFEAAQWARENMLKLCHYFILDDLSFARRGGRITGFAAFIGSLIKIKPLLHVDDNGKLMLAGKSIGKKKSFCKLVERMKELTGGQKQRIFISHGDCLEDANYIAERVTEETGITDITIGAVGPIVGAHAGPGTVALFFMGKNR